MIRKAIANRRRRKWYRRLLEGGIVNLTEAQIRRLEAVGEDVEIIFGHLDWPGVCHVRLPPPANQFQTLTQDTFDRLSEYKARAETAEAQLGKVRELVEPRWRANHGLNYADLVEAYAAGRNDFIDKVREVLGVSPRENEGSTHVIVRAVTGFTDEEINELGGVTDE